jgi:hypothetical protein
MPTKSEEKKQHHTNKVETILEWSAPGRPFKKRTKQYYLTATLIALLVEVILFLFSEYMLMLAVFSLVFLAFALAKVPPKDFKYRISSEGITVEDRFFLWQELYDFYFKKRDGYETVHIRTQAYLPGELILTLGNESSEKVKNALLPYLPFREFVKPTFVDRAAEWLARNFPLENK